MQRKKIVIFLLTLFLLTGFCFKASADYFSGAVWEPAHNGNFSDARNTGEVNFKDRGIDEINLIVIHVGQCSYQSIINWFRNPAARSSSHYAVGKNGSVAAMVRDEDIAWHAGNWPYNVKSIGIEHGGYVSDSFSYELYQSSAELVRYLVSKYKIPPRQISGIGNPNPDLNSGLLGHNQIPDYNNPPRGGGVNHHTDPGPNWNWNYYLNLVTGGGNPDLILDYLHLDPKEFLPGEDIRIKTKVKNIGRGDTIGAFFISLYVDGAKINSKEVASLNSNQTSNEISFYYQWPLDVDEHRIEVKVEDKYNYILESNFDNNNRAVAKKAFESSVTPIIISPAESLEINFGQEVNFRGSWKDENKNKIEKYIWVSNLDGKLSENLEFSVKNLSKGNHKIYFSVKDIYQWSEPAVIEIKVGSVSGDDNSGNVILTCDFKEKKEVLNFSKRIKFGSDNKNLKEIRYCFERNCIPSKTLAFPYEIALKESKDIILRVQSVSTAGSLSKIKEIKFKLRRVDINGDGRVDKYDFVKMMAEWEKTNFNPADLNGDRIVNKYDFVKMMAYWDRTDTPIR